MPNQITPEALNNVARLFISYNSQKRRAENPLHASNSLKEYFGGKTYALVETFGTLVGLDWDAAFRELTRLASVLPEVTEASK